MASHEDVVVIGAGLGGLASAVASARAGRRVLLLERRSGPGGYAQSFQRGPYRFDASLHALNGLAPGGGFDEMYRHLGIWDRVRLRRLDPMYAVRFPDRDIVAHADIFRYESALVAQFPQEAAGIRSYMDEAWAVYADWRRLRDRYDAEPGVSEDQLRASSPTLEKAAAETWAQMIGRHVRDPRLVAVLGALWGYLGMPPEMTSAALGASISMSYGHHGAWYVEGGSGAVAWALEQALRDHGGEVRYSQTVTSVEVRGGRAVAVETAEGLRVETDTVISNASIPTTTFDLVGRDHFPAGWVSRMEGTRPSMTTFSLYLGLNRDVFAEQALPHELFVMPGYDAVAAGMASVSADWAHAGMAIADYTQVDPGCAPPGGGVAVITAGVAWAYSDVWGTGGDLRGYHDNPRYLAVKERVAQEILARVDTAVPGLAEAVRFMEAATPLTNLRYTGNPSGAIVGYQNTAGDPRLSQLLPQVTTPIENLFLAGAWTNTGGQNPAIESGMDAARAALEAHVQVH